MSLVVKGIIHFRGFTFELVEAPPGAFSVRVTCPGGDVLVLSPADWSSVVRTLRINVPLPSRSIRLKVRAKPKPRRKRPY